jgi:large subunit ribosomal protein L21
VTAEAAGAVLVPEQRSSGRDEMTDTYAIVESGGKQYRAEKGSVLVVDRLRADEGAKVALRAVMFRGPDEVALNGGDLEKVKVEATVAEHLRGEKVRVFKYRPKKGYRRRAGHRSELTKLEVTDVKMLSRRPAAKAKPKAEEKAKPKAEEKPKPKPKPKAKGASGAAKRGASEATGKAAPKRKPAKKTGGAAKQKGSGAKKATERKPSTRKTSQRKKES